MPKFAMSRAIGWSIPPTSPVLAELKAKDTLANAVTECWQPQ